MRSASLLVAVSSTLWKWYVSYMIGAGPAMSAADDEGIAYFINPKHIEITYSIWLVCCHCWYDSECHGDCNDDVDVCHGLMMDILVLLCCLTTMS